MSKEPASPADGRPARSTSGAWAVDAGQAQTMLTTARKALFVMAGVLILIWVIQIVNVADSYNLTATYGVRARDVSSLPYLLTAPFLHFSWTHIEGNSGPLFIFGFLAAYRGIGKFAALTLVVVLTSGIAAWFFGTPGSVEAGASGVVFGYFGYIIVRGLFDRHAIDVLIGAIMALCFAYQFAVLLPQNGISWQAHVGGLVGGIASGWIFRERRAPRAATRTITASSPAALPGTAVLPAGPGAGKASKKAGRTSAGIDPANPRADLYKQLDDLGL